MKYSVVVLKNTLVIIKTKKAEGDVEFFGSFESIREAELFIASFIDWQKKMCNKEYFYKPRRKRKNE